MKKSSIFIIVLVVLIAGAFAGAKFYGEKKAREILDDNIARTSIVATVTYGDVSFNPLTFKTTVSGVKIAPNGSAYELDVREIKISRYDSSSPSPMYMDIAMNGIVVDLESAGMGGDMAEAAAVLSMLGYKKLDMDISLAYEYRQQSREMDISYGLDVSEMGNIGFSMGLGNIDLNDNSMAALLFDYTTLTLRDMRLTYRDASLAGRITKMIAEQQGIDDKQLIESMNSEIDSSISKDTEEGKTYSVMIMKASRKFINAPGAFVVTVKPEKPIGFGELFGIEQDEEAFKALNLNIEI